MSDTMGLFLKDTIHGSCDKVRDALIDQVAMLTTERDTLAGKAAQQEADLVAATDSIERERKPAGEAQTEAATAHLKIEGFTEKLAEQAGELERLRAALEASQQARQAAQQTSAVTAARLEASLEARKAAEAWEQTAQVSAQTLARELSAANLVVQAGQARLEAAARELDAVSRVERVSRLNLPPHSSSPNLPASHLVVVA